MSHSNSEESPAFKARESVNTCWAPAGWATIPKNLKSKKVEMSLKPLRYKQLRRYENSTTGQ